MSNPTPSIKMPEGGQEALDMLRREVMTDAIRVASSDIFDGLTPMQARSLAASALVAAAADLATEGARWEKRRPRITRFLAMCRRHFEASRDGPWETFKPVLRFVVTIPDDVARNLNNHGKMP